MASLGTGASASAVIGIGATASISGVYTNPFCMRFVLKSSPNDLKLSQHACCVVETCNTPST